MNRLTEDLKRTASDALADAQALANRSLNLSLPPPALSFRQRGKVAGSAHLTKNEIRLNPVLFAENPEYFIQQVIPHELCHLLVARLWGRVKPHGPEWQGLMTEVFDLSPDVTHHLNVDSVKGRTFMYRCDCGTTELSVRRHNRVQRNEQRYICKICRCELKPA